MGIETIALVALAGGTALQAIGSVQQGNQQRKLAEAQAAQLDQQAAQERDAALAQAEKIRRAGRSQAAQAESAYAASGVSVGIGTPVRINEQITHDAEEDAYMTILSGNRRGQTLETESGLTRRSGKNAQQAGYMGAASSVLSGAATYGKWKMSK